MNYIVVDKITRSGYPTTSPDYLQIREEKQGIKTYKRIIRDEEKHVKELRRLKKKSGKRP